MASVEVRQAHSAKSGEVFESVEAVRSYLEGLYQEDGKLPEALSLRFQGEAVIVANKQQADEALDRHDEEADKRADERGEDQPQDAEGVEFSDEQLEKVEVKEKVEDKDVK